MFNFIKNLFSKIKAQYTKVKVFKEKYPAVSISVLLTVFAAAIFTYPKFVLTVLVYNAVVSIATLVLNAISDAIICLGVLVSPLITKVKGAASDIHNRNSYRFATPTGTVIEGEYVILL